MTLERVTMTAMVRASRAAYSSQQRKASAMFALVQVHPDDDAATTLVERVGPHEREPTSSATPNP